MRIVSFSIENFRNIRFAECHNVPDFMVICGGNGCGKTALLEAIMTAKEHAGAYGNFLFDQRAVSADSEKSTIMISLTFSKEEIDFVKQQYNENCPEKDEIIIEIAKGGAGKAIKRSLPVIRLLSYFSRSLGSPGFFDYITAQRQIQKSQLQTWESGFLREETAKTTLAGQNKFQYTKQYLAGLKMRDLQSIQSSSIEGNPDIPDSLDEIRKIFDRFFAPLVFKDVYLYKSPFEFIVKTPQGEIDIDDMSSGEKEILNIFIRFHQLRPNGAVILFDEADAHLHPDLERRYLNELKNLTKGNQIILTTHSPEMMIAAGPDSLFTILKEPLPNHQSQLVQVTQSEHLHDVLSEIMGSRGLISFNQRIVFIEGENSSADRAIYEAFYPPNQYNVSFVPAGNSSAIRKIAEQVNDLLTSSIVFQQYYSIIDRDIDRMENDPTSGSRLFRLPVYHVENFLLNCEEIFYVTRSMLGLKCPYNNAQEVEKELKELVLSDNHVNPYTRAILDAKLSLIAKESYDAVYKRIPPKPHDIPEFETIEAEARLILKGTIDNGTWRNECKARDLIRAYCYKHSLNYEHFRNSLISRIKTPPPALEDIMVKILGRR